MQRKGHSGCVNQLINYTSGRWKIYDEALAVHNLLASTVEPLISDLNITWSEHKKSCLIRGAKTILFYNPTSILVELHSDGVWAKKEINIDCVKPCVVCVESCDAH